jgi:transposase InsO family protein
MEEGQEPIGQGNLEWDNAPRWKKLVAFRKLEDIKAFEQWAQENIHVGNAEGKRAIYCALRNDGEIPSISPKARRKKLTPPTLKRRIRSYKKDGIIGLLPKTGRPGERALSEKGKDKIRGILYLNSRTTAAHIHRELKASGEKISYPTVRRFVRKERKRNPQFHAWLDNPDRHRGSFVPAFGKADQNISYINQLWEADASRTVNVLIDGKIYFFYVVIDIFSRRAKVLIIDRPRASVLAALLRMTINDWGKPEAIRVDFGKDFRAKEIAAGLERLKIRIAPMLPYSPQMKGYVERFIGRYKRQFLQYQPGFIGQDAEEAAAIRAREREFKGKIYESRLSLQGLQEKSNEWIREKYEQTPHRGLDGMLPVVKAAQSPVPAQYIPDRATNFLLCPSGIRKMTREGIFYKGGRFFSLEIADLIGQEVEVREDLENAGLVYVFAGSPREFRGIAKDASLADYSPDQYKEAKKQQRADNREEARARGVLAENYLQEKESRPKKTRTTMSPLIRRVKFDSHEVREASKLAEVRTQLEDEIRAPEAIAQPDGEGFFYGSDSEIRDYENIMRKIERGEPITDRERKVKEDCEDENNRLFRILQKAEEGSK